MPRSGVQFINNDEPAFIRQFKQRIGHKDEPGVDAKRQIPNFDDDNEDDGTGIEKEDEKPVVVVLKDGDLTQEEADKAEKEVDEGPAHLDKKITFKKPTKRTKDEGKDGGGEGSASKSKKKDSGSEATSKKDKLKNKNTKLLSFGDEEEEDE